MKALSASFILFFFCEIVLGQKQGNMWYFGDHAGLDFNSGSPVSVTNGQTILSGNPDWHQEGGSSICDSSGALLFYTDGRTIWNNNHQVMQNGDSLLGHWSSSQPAIIVPKPGSSRFFYVFTTDAFYEDFLQYGFRYSVVDMCLNNGLGGVMYNQKNIKLLDTVAEKLTAVRHSNGTDYWIITHKYFSDAFYCYHLSSAGIIDTVVSNIGMVHPPTIQFPPQYMAIGQMKASPNGQKLAVVAGNGSNVMEYFSFNNSTGVVSNRVTLATNTYYSYGTSFSPDNSKLYVTVPNGNYYGLWQYDLAAGNGHPDSVRASKYGVYTGSNSTSCYGLQLGPDGKIYMAGAAGSVNPNDAPAPYISVINAPNLKFAACNFVRQAITLNGSWSSIGLPNFIDSYGYTNTVNTENCTPAIRLQANVSPVPASCGNMCSGSASAVVSGGTPPYNYQWQPGNYNTSQVSNLCPGIYSVTISDALGDTSISSVTILQNTSISVSAFTVNAECGNNNGSIHITTNSGLAPFTYMWNTGDTLSFILNQSAGTYSVIVTDVNGCSATVSSIISSSGNTSATITVNKTIFCSGDSAIICAPTGFALYLWNTGQTDSCIKAKLAGNYYVTVTDNNGCTAESNRLPITVLPSPPVSISVNGDTLSVFNAVAQQWYLNGSAITGATSNIYIANQSGSYTVAITDSNGCRATSNPTFVTGIENVSEEDVVSVYPNPLSTGNWQLTVGNNFIGGVVEVFDDKGSSVYRSLLNGHQLLLELNAARGVYLLRITSARGSVARKLIRL